MKSQIKIMVVEDNEDDLYLTERTLSKKGIKSIFNAPDGRIAINYLLGEGAFSDRELHPLPDAILLDLKLPEISGHQVLEWINTRPELSACLVFILSSSGETRDRDRASNAKAAGYFVKPFTEKNVDEILARVVMV